MVRLSGGQRGGGQEHGHAARRFPALAAYAGTANQLVLRVGCFNRGTPCSVDTGGGISHILHGSDVTINDPTPPALAVEASGLLAGGARSGSDPVTLTASDGAGIRRVELIDVTNPAAPAVVGVEDYGESRTDANRHLRLQPARAVPRAQPRDGAPDRAARRPAPASSSASPTPAATSSTSGPYPVFAVTPSDRGALNGAGRDRDAARCRVVWTAGGKSNRRTLELRRQGRQSAAGCSTATASRSPAPSVVLLTRDLRRGATVVPRTTLTTTADGRFSTTVSRDRLAAAAVRLALARQRHPLRRQRLPDAAGPRERDPDRLHPPPARRPQLHGQRAAARRLARRRAGDRPGPRARLQALRDVRRHDDVEQRPLQGQLPLPQLRLARAQLRLPRAHPPRRRASPTRPATRRRTVERVAGRPGLPQALRSRLPSVYGHGRRER